MSRSGPIVASLLVAVAVGALLLEIVTFRYDDVIYYWKSSTLALGYLPEVPPGDPRLVSTVEHFAHPKDYQPHPGPNLPYLDFGCEYPALAWIFLLFPHLFSHGIYLYILAFMGEMVLLHLLTIGLLSRLAERLKLPLPPPWQTTAFFSAFTLLVSISLVRRFDISSSVLVAGAALALGAKRPTLSGLLLGFGAATKLWPGMLVPFFVLPSLADRHHREALKLGLAAGLGFLLPHVPVMAYAGTKAFSYLLFHGERGLQIESVWGNFAVVAKKLMGQQPVSDLSHSAAHIALEPTMRSLLVGLSYVAMLGGASAMWWAAWRRIRSTSDFAERIQILLLGSLGLVLVTLASAKVFSPQYLLWLVPFVYALTGSSGRALRWGVLAVALLTRIEFTTLFVDVARYTWPGTLVVLARNLLVIWLAWRTFRALREAPQSSPEETEAPALAQA